ncbi:hypothetical protein FKO01_04125 [Mesorhizobium sp. B2-3-3]|nr:hypothetical protein FKO01_04125 [Mesorhizobium sp. B2-3-3]
MKILISSDIHSDSLLSVGDAIEQWAQTRQRANRYRYPGANIWIMTQGGDLYLMSDRETKQPKVAFMPIDADELARILRLLRPN